MKIDKEITWREGASHLAIPLTWPEGGEVLHIRIPMTIPEQMPPGARYVSLLRVMVAGQPIFAVDLNVRKMALRLACPEGNASGAIRTVWPGDYRLDAAIVPGVCCGAGDVRVSAPDEIKSGAPLGLLLGLEEPAPGGLMPPWGFTFHGLELGVGHEIDAPQPAPDELPLSESEVPEEKPPAIQTQPFLLDGLLQLYRAALAPAMELTGGISPEGAHQIARAQAEVSYRELRKLAASGEWGYGFRESI